MRVPFVDFKREWKFFEKKFLLAFKKFGRSGIYVLGPEVEKFERNFAEFCGYKYVIGVSTGLSALEIILRAYDVGENDEVITVANSAVATALAISNVGAKPVFCDIGNDFLIDFNKIENLITKRTKAILPVHLFGKICNMEKINAIAKKYNLLVIEDACQAHGANFTGASSIHTKAFSFYPTKNLGALGEAGAVVTNDIKVRDFAMSYRNYGQQSRYCHVIKGNNNRIDAMQCVLMNIKLKYIHKLIKLRQEIFKSYVKAFKKIDTIIVDNYDQNFACHLFVMRILNGQRDGLKKYLQENGVDALVHYPISIYRQPCYEKEYKNIELEITDQLQEEILSLPCYPFLKKQEQDRIIKIVANYFNK